MASTRTEPTFGVCVRSVGRADDVARALESVAAQSTGARLVQVVVMEDGRPGNLRPLVERFAPHLSLLLIRGEVPIGKGAAANRAMAAMTAPWLCLLDEDDAWYPHHLATILSALEIDGSPRVIYTDTDTAVRAPGGGRVVTGTHRWDGDSADLATMQDAPIACSVAIHRTAWEAVGGFDPRMRRVFDDWDLYQRLAQRVDFQHLPEVTSCYTVGSGNKAWSERAAFLHALSMAPFGGDRGWTLSAEAARRLAARRISTEADIGHLEHVLAEVRRAAGHRPQDEPLESVAATWSWVEPPPPRLPAEATRSVRLEVRNVGRSRWNSWGGRYPIHLSYHWLDRDGGAVVWDGMRTPLPADIAPGARVTAALLVETPEVPGRYLLQPDVVQEAVGWASQRRGGGGVARPVEVTPW